MTAASRYRHGRFRKSLKIFRFGGRRGEAADGRGVIDTLPRSAISAARRPAGRARPYLGRTGGAGNDIFVFHVGEASGDTVLDFAGNGVAAGDSLQFVGYGAGATFTNIEAAHWQVNDNGSASHDAILSSFPARPMARPSSTSTDWTPPKATP
jgi:hypothetical protein